MNILAIDQGTSATKALLVGPGGEVLGRGEVPVRTRSVGADGVEADPEELFDSVLVAGRRALAAAGAPAHAVALANQGETVLAWDRGTGRPLSPAIVWQDRRSGGVCARLTDRAAELAAITGLPLDPYFAAPKMTWLRENLTADGTVTTTDTWLLHRLGAEYVTDAATASRTMLLDLDSAAWSGPACAAFGLDPGALPAVADCAGIVGETSLFGPAPDPSPGSPSTSRPRCWPRAAWPRATPSARTARARSSWSRPVLRRCGPARGCPVRWPGGSAAR